MLGIGNLKRDYIEGRDTDLPCSQLIGARAGLSKIWVDLGAEVGVCDMTDGGGLEIEVCGQKGDYSEDQVDLDATAAIAA